MRSLQLEFEADIGRAVVNFRGPIVFVVASEVPADDAWLTSAERAIVERLVIAKRRADWLLGRWTAKSLVGSELTVASSEVEISAAGDGAPEAFIAGDLVPLSVSLSHRDGVAVSAVAPLPTRVGIDLETIEPRSDAFVREWLSASKQTALAETGAARDVQALCCWTAKEASAKVLREGLRLDVRHAVVDAAPGHSDWNPLRVDWHTEHLVHSGWWRCEGGAVLAVVSDPPHEPPRRADVDGLW